MRAYEMKSDQKRTSHVEQRNYLCGLLQGAVSNSELVENELEIICKEGVIV
jgi:hypothetical protein